MTFFFVREVHNDLILATSTKETIK